MKTETNHVFVEILNFKNQIKEVQTKGLIKLTVEEREDRVKAIDDLFHGLGPENTEKPNSGGAGRKDKKKDKTVV